jgi:hypothetical protein
LLARPSWFARGPRSVAEGLRLLDKSPAIATAKSHPLAMCAAVLACLFAAVFSSWRFPVIAQKFRQARGQSATACLFGAAEKALFVSKQSDIRRHLSAGLVRVGRAVEGDFIAAINLAIR